VTSFTIDYELGTPAKVAVTLFDENTKRENKPMGTAVFEIGELLGARGNTKAKQLPKNGGTLFATARKSVGSGLLRFQFKGLKLKNVEGMFGKSDPFFELSRRVDAAGSLTWDNVYRSKVVKNNLNPEWEGAAVELSQLCGGDHDAPILLQVFDFESTGKHVGMGQCETTVNALVASVGKEMKLLKKGKDVGTIVVVRAEMVGVKELTEQMAVMSVSTNKAAPAAGAAFVMAPPLEANFIDYVSGGCELNVVVAIDFTGSNGDPRQPGSLHYMNPNGRNDYQRAIAAIVSILEKYDTDRKFPVVGFGAKYGGVVRHCFQCGKDAEAHGLDGVLAAYQQVFQSGLVMSGPTVFTEVIDMAASRAEAALNEACARGTQAYTILLILTDGAVSDVQATAASLRKASSSPLSVVIVGVGNADFSAMQFLDDSAGGSRDIAQFVQFNLHSTSSVALTSETLREIPDQLTSCFRSRGIAPLPPQQPKSDDEIAVEPEDEEIDLRLNIGADEEDIVVAGGGDGFVDGFAATR
jgi:hypothetical protein